MDSDGLKRRAHAAVIYKLPHLRGTELPAVIVETSQFLVLALWSGLLLGAAIIVPVLARKLLPSLEATTFLTGFTGFTNLLGAGIGALLLLTGLLQHTLELRPPRTALIQMALFLLMTVVLVACQVLLVGKLDSVLREVQTSEASAEILATTPALHRGVQWLHGFALLLALASLIVGWRPRVSVKHQVGTIKVFKMPT